MILQRNRVVLRTVLLWTSCAFLLQGAWAAFSGSGFLAEGSFAESSSRKFVLVDSSVTDSSFASLSISSADPPNGDDLTLVYHHHDLLGSVVTLSNKDAEAIEYFFPISTEKGSKTLCKVEAFQPKKAATKSANRYTSFGKATFYEPDLTPVPELTSNYSNRHLYTGREHLREFLEGEGFRAKKLAFVTARFSKDLQLPTLNDHRNRYYSPHLARWTTTDPIQFQAGDINLYRYVGNGVTGLVDLMGLLVDGEVYDFSLITAIRFYKERESYSVSPSVGKQFYSISLAEEWGSAGHVGNFEYDEGSSSGLVIKDRNPIPNNKLSLGHNDYSRSYERPLSRVPGANMSKAEFRNMALGRMGAPSLGKKFMNIEEDSALKGHDFGCGFKFVSAGIISVNQDIDASFLGTVISSVINTNISSFAIRAAVSRIGSALSAHYLSTTNEYTTHFVTAIDVSINRNGELEMDLESDSPPSSIWSESGYVTNSKADFFIGHHGAVSGAGVNLSKENSN